MTQFFSTFYRSKPTCIQWYQTDATGGVYFKRWIPEASGLQAYTLPNPVECDWLRQSFGWNYFVAEVSDEGGFSHVSAPVLVYGDCEP